MDSKEYAKRVEGLERLHICNLRALMRECALSNNTVRHNDIVEDEYGRIRVTHLSVGVPPCEDAIPSVLLNGVILNPDGTPNKHNKCREIWANRVIRLADEL